MRCPGLAALALLIPTAVACTTMEEEEFVIRGCVRDAATGERVSRETLYLHFFCDEIDFQRTLDPSGEYVYSAAVPRRTVRVRAFDTELVYELFEKTVRIRDQLLDYDIRLEATSYVRLHGKVLVVGASGTEPVVPRGGLGETPIFGFVGEDGIDCRTGRFHHGSDGTYSVNVPRRKLGITVIDTPYGLRDRELDLSTCTADEYEFDLVLVE